MKKHKIRRAIRLFDIVLALVCSVIMCFVAIGSYCLPDRIVTCDNDDDDVRIATVFSCNTDGRVQPVDSRSAVPVQRTLRLFGVVPVKTVAVANNARPTVMVSGEAFGIKLYTDGVIVVGTRSVNADGGEVDPAEAAGIEVGDVIVSINGQNVYSSDEVQEILNDNNGMEYRIRVKRDDRYRTFTLTPAYSQREGCYKAGMWVRDSTAGIGTITYYDKNTGIFGALGHQINDVDTNEIMPLLEGEAVDATVTSVQRGVRGTTGSLVCDFGTRTIGTLLGNTDCGVFGAYSGVSECAVEYPVATRQEVKRGNAKMLCTIDGTGVQEFDIEITRVSLRDKNDGQNMVVRITDDRLISATGGIVQGMSGSPIIQNGRLVGAVTHVMIDNPEKGYAIFAETMMDKYNMYNSANSK